MPSSSSLQLFLIPLTGTLLAASFSPDLYLQIRPVIAEAEHASARFPTLPDKSNPLESVAHLYARAGYLSDAARVLKTAGIPSDRISRSRTLYGDLEGALQSINSTRNPSLKTSQITALAMILRNMGESHKAAAVLD